MSRALLGSTTTAPADVDLPDAGVRRRHPHLWALLVERAVRDPLARPSICHGSDGCGN